VTTRPARIEIDRLCLDIPVYGDSGSRRQRDLLRRMGRSLSPGKASATTVIRVLDDISLSLEPGMRVGLTGPNGAGKTSLLRMMAGIYRPTSGRIDVQGHVVPLFNLGLGISPNATGYENIVNVGMLFGYSEPHIREKIDEIAEFTELGEALERPLRTYSNGMRLRIAFAVATHTDPEILLIDEIVSVGDKGFRDKAAERMRDFAGRAQILVVASHSEPLLEELCTHIINLEGGRLEGFGPIEQVTPDD
jgi:ABC-type polysaccharide/polyol phosphate transport system ATPase subunit